MKTEHTNHSHYKHLILMTILAFACMYILMYAMVNTWSEVIPNTNQFYMAGLMAAPMVIIEILVMRSMYMDKMKNLAFIIGAIVLLVTFYFGIRSQSLVGDKQFLKSMIPHHSAAILMCREGNITDPEIKQLCNGIIANQQKEIDQMNIILKKKQQ
jgi:uncharacterized protein (DUF305 family)